MDFSPVNFRSTKDMVVAAAHLLRQHLEMPAPSAPHALLLTGGRTAPLVYRSLSGGGRPLHGDWHIIASDERHVPHENADSNYTTLVSAVRALGLPPEKLLAPDPALPLAQAAQYYHLRISKFLEQGGRIPIGLLSLGGDGHLASLFTPQDWESYPEQYAIAVPRPSPPDRISVTPYLLTRVEKILVLVAGREKRHALEQLLAGDRRLPAVHILATAPQVLVWHAETGS